jgi:hypothetical protein
MVLGMLVALVALRMLVPAPALAHPFIRGGGQVPVQSLATIELDLAHGCGDEAAGSGARTDEVALEAPAWLWVVEVPEVDGWDVDLEDPDADGTVVVVWTATTGAVPAPRFSLSVVADGTEGETRHLRVSQRCGDRIERWVGTPEGPAEQPAILLRLTAPDAAAPPPERAAPTAPTPGSEPGQMVPGAGTPLEPSVDPAPGSADAAAPGADDRRGRSPADARSLVPALALAALGIVAAGTARRSLRRRRGVASDPPG